jgi:DNA-binding GntR family transcriptional regulator
MSSAASLTLPLPRRQTLGQSVTDSLREAIYLGRFLPGERIGQAQVAQQLGVSQAPVREALAALEREGLVERTANQGASVIEIDPDDAREIFALRAALETAAARLVLRRSPAADLSALEANIQAMQRAESPEELALLDVAFHEAFVRLAGNRRLLACWQTMLSQLRLVLARNNALHGDSRGATIDNHRRFLALLRAGDEAAVVASIERQHDEFCQMIVDQLIATD